MSERKVLNKYYPPDFDPSKIPRLKVARDGKFGIRLMAPFNMRCNTCGEYIYKGKKFNSRKETVSDEKYLGLHIFRFYIKCPRCIAEIAFKTDPENTDYTLEAGATRNFEALKTAERLAKKEMEEIEAEEKNNPMKVLENRTQASLREMDMIETLEELRELRQKHSTVNIEEVLRVNAEDLEELERQRAAREEEEDEQFVRSIFGKDGVRVVKRLDSDEEDKSLDKEEEEESEKKKSNGSVGVPPAAKRMKPADTRASDLLTMDLPSIKNEASSSKSSASHLSGSNSKSDPFTKPSTAATSSLKKSLLSGIIVHPKSSAKPSVATVTEPAAGLASARPATAVAATPAAEATAGLATEAADASSGQLGGAARPTATAAGPTVQQLSTNGASLAGLASLSSYSSGSESD